MCYRKDERVIKLIEAAEWFEKSSFDIKKIPVGCVYEIREYDDMESVRWSLPKDKIIDDLRMIVLGELEKENANPLTKQFLDYGKSFDEFNSYFHGKVNGEI